jgi:predicted amidohydrolase YtcJ
VTAHFQVGRGAVLPGFPDAHVHLALIDETALRSGELEVLA